MNKTQRITLVIASVFITILLFYPPYYATRTLYTRSSGGPTWHNSGRFKTGYGHHWVWKPPDGAGLTMTSAERYVDDYNPDLLRLGLYILFCATCAGMVYRLSANRYRPLPRGWDISAYSQSIYSAVKPQELAGHKYPPKFVLNNKQNAKLAMYVQDFADAVTLGDGNALFKARAGIAGIFYQARKQSRRRRILRRKSQ